MTYLVPFFMAQYGVSASGGGVLLTLMQGAGLFGPLAIAWFSDRSGKRRGITQATLLLSALMTVWLVQHDSLSVMFYLNLILYGAFGYDVAIGYTLYYTTKQGMGFLPGAPRHVQ